MAGFEMEPVFCKALKLLHSSTKESADEIMHLLEEILDQKYGGTKSLNLKSGTLIEEPSKATENQKPPKPSRGPSPVQSVPVSEKSSRDSSPPSEPVSSRTTPEMDDGDLALEIFEEDLNCKICKGIAVGPRNRLVECSDCHMLYHQECHKPPISENINDPRLVWYCSSCTKKTQEKVQPKIKPIPPEPPHKKTKSETTTEPKNPLFKRSEKSSNNNSHSKNSSGNGMANLAASLQGSKPSTSSSTTSKHHPSSSSNSKLSGSLNYSKMPSSPNSKPQSGSAPAPANIIAADKRLQNMKKKAAAKMQEKRTKHK